VLRGGAWNNNQNNARCAYRNRNNPNNRNNNLGFRVVFSPHLFVLCQKCGAVMNCVAEAFEDGRTMSWLRRFVRPAKYKKAPHIPVASWRPSVQGAFSLLLTEN
jgi:hypothetical protein